MSVNFVISGAIRENVMASGFGEERQASFSGVPAGGSAGFSEGEMLKAKLKVGPGGRVLIPAAMRDLLGVSEGDALMASLERGELRLISLAESVRRAQAIVRSKVPAGVSLVDELLADRRQEVLAERRNG
jgi:AbrB family looped-hinge helix DNA binding protein